MTETKEKYVRKIPESGRIVAIRPMYIREDGEVTYYSYEERDDFVEVKSIRFPKEWNFVTFEETEDKGIFVARESTKYEALNKYDYIHRRSEIRVMNANAYVTKQRDIRFQMKDLQPIMSQKVGGYFYIHYVKNEKEYLEISFSHRKKLQTLQEEAIKQYGSVLEMTVSGQIDITYRVNPVGAGATFPVPAVFLSGVEKCTYLPYHYEKKKIVVERPAQKCSCCGKEISSYYSFKETVSICEKCAETLDMISDKTLSTCGTTRDTIKGIIENYGEIIKSNENIKKELVKANKKMNAVLGGKRK